MRAVPMASKPLRRAVPGVDYPMLRGLLAFLPSYVPNIGSIIAAVPAVLFVAVQLGPGAALWSAAGYLVVNVVVDSIIEPRFMGRGLGLSALVVFLSLVFWGWVLGPVGMFLSVPLTMMIKIALDSRPDTHWIAVLLGPEVRRRRSWRSGCRSRTPGPGLGVRESVWVHRIVRMVRQGSGFFDVRAPAPDWRYARPT